MRKIKMKTLAYTKDSQNDLMQKLKNAGWQKIGDTKHGKEIFERHGQKIYVVDFYRDYRKGS